MIRRRSRRRRRRGDDCPTIARCASSSPTTTATSRPASPRSSSACEGLGELDVVAPEQNASGTSNSLTLQSRPLGLQRRQRLPLHQRHAVRLRPPRALGPARAPARPGRLRHQQRRQHGRRHALLGHRRRGDGRLSCSAFRRSRSRRWRRAGRISTPPARVARERHRAGAARAAGDRRPGCSTSTSRTAPMPTAAAPRHPPRPPPCQRAGDPPDQPARRHDVLDRPAPATRARPAPGTDFHATAQRRGLDHAAAGRPHRPRHAAGLARLGRQGRRMTATAGASKFPLRSTASAGAARRRRARRPCCGRSAPLPHAHADAARRDRPSASASTRPTCARAWSQRLRAEGIADAARARRDRRRAAPSLRRQRRWSTQAYEDTSLPIGHRPDDLQAVGRGAHDRAAVRRRAMRAPRGDLGACSRSAPAAATRPRCWRSWRSGCLDRAAASRCTTRRASCSRRCAPRNLRLVFGDGMLGHPPGAPYDSIIAAAGGDDDARRPGSTSSPSAAAWSRRCSSRGGGQVLVVVDRRARWLRPAAFTRRCTSSP